MSYLLLQSDARRIPLGDKSVHCVVTSPPYWNLRDYGTPGQLGMEPTPDEYVANLVRVFREVNRVLRDDGTCWLNLGTSFISGKIESHEYVIRDDLTPEEKAHVYAELARHFEAESKAMSGLRQAEASPEQDVPRVLGRGEP